MFSRRLLRLCMSIAQQGVHLPLCSVVAALLLAGAAAEAEDDPVSRVRSLSWHGNRGLKDSQLGDYMLTEGPSWRWWRSDPEFSQADLDRDIERLATLYQSHGYYQSQSSYTLEWDEEKQSVAISIDIDEGPATLLAEFEIDLPDEVLQLDSKSKASEQAEKRGEFLEGFPLEVGEIFSIERYRESRQLLLRRLAESGHPRAQIDGGAEVEVAESEATVHWRVTAGQPVVFGTTSVSGLTKVEASIVQREVAMEEGAPYTVSAQTRTRRRLQSLGLFRWIVIQPRPLDSPQAEGTATQELAEPRVWPMEIQLAERPPRSVQIGGGWGTDEEWRARLSWHHRNFFGDGRRLDLRLRYSKQLAYVRPIFSQPYLFGTAMTLQLSPSFVVENEDAYSAERVLVDLDLFYPLPRHWSLRGGYHLGRNDVHNVDQPPKKLDFPPEPEGIFTTSGPALGFRRTTVINPVDAQGGTFLDLLIESSLTGLGANIDFIRYTFQARGYYPILGCIAAGRLLLGTLQDFGDTSAIDIPSVERFFSGGSNSMRGFGFRKLSPRNLQGDPVGGSSIIEASVELRFPIWRQLAGVVFVDSGNVEREAFDWRIKDLFFAAGPGLRYKTPVGPLRLDLAWRLNPSEHLGDFRISVSVGQAF